MRWRAGGGTGGRGGRGGASLFSYSTVPITVLEFLMRRVDAVGTFDGGILP